MKIRLEAGRKGGLLTRLEGRIAFLEKTFEGAFQAGVMIEVMISGMNPVGTVYFIRPVGPEHKLVEHTGFEMAGSMCRTTAWIPELNASLTPGRLPVRYASNVNTGFYGRPREALKPGRCYIDMSYRKNGLYRCEGVDATEELIL